MHRRNDDAGRDGVHADAVFRVLHRQVLGDRFKTAFGEHRHRRRDAPDGLRARAAVIVTMLPPVFCANICLMVSWVTYRKPSTFVETSDLKSSVVYSVNGLVKKMPALLTSASIDLKRASAVSMILAAVAGSPM